MSISEKIWKTKKIRINTESRLLANNKIVNYLIPLYSVNFIIITLIPIDKNGDWITFISLVGSIVILVVSIITSNSSFILRANKMKTHYIKLDRLYSDSIKTKDSKELEIIYDKYQSELDNIENHSKMDYLKTIIMSKSDSGANFKKPDKKDIFDYWSFKVLKLLLFIFLFSMPILLDILICL